MRNIITLLMLCLVGNAVSQTLYPYSNAGKMGYCDENKKVIIQPDYNETTPFKHGLGFVKKGNLWGAVNKTGKLVIPAKYEDIRFGYNFFVIADSIKYDVLNGSLSQARLALFDTTGKRIYKARFNKLPEPDPYTSNPSEIAPPGNYAFAEGGKYGTMNEKYKITAPATTASPAYSSQGLTCVKVGGKYGFKDSKGAMVIPAKYDNETTFNSWGVACVALNEKYGVIDKKGNTIINFEYDDITVCWNTGYFTIKQNGKCGLANRQGKIIIPPSLSYPVFYFDAGLQARYDEKTKKYGFMDTTGNYAIAPQYESAGTFHAGKALVKINGKQYFINTKNEKITPEYDNVYTNCTGDTLYIVFQKDEVWGVADPNGKELFVLPGVSSLTTFCDTHNYLQAVKDGAYGIVNLKGEWIVQPKFAASLEYYNGLFYTWDKKQKVYILPNGTELRD